MENKDNKKIRVLHIVKDEKFFDGVINAFESDERFDNRSILVVNSAAYKFSRIKQTAKVELVWSREMLKDCLESSDYDAIFFHSLTASQYKYFQYIPKDRIVIWWSWGVDIYNGSHGMSPLIQMDLYKPLTLKLYNERRKNILCCVKDLFTYISGLIEKNHYYRLRNNAMSRIDFFQPVIPLEYKIMKGVDGFRAKEFYYPECFMSYQVDTKSIKRDKGAILIGNSATYTNNHLDIWDSIKNFVSKGRDVIIPVNYGFQRYTKNIATRIQSNSHNIRFILDFMPKDEYFQLLNDCSYAVFGVIRQQAMGNINYCLSHGMKVFLYRDSMVYRFLKDNGYVVFAIEEIDENSFSHPLTQYQVLQNSIAFEREKEYINKTREEAFEMIIKKCNQMETE